MLMNRKLTDDYKKETAMKNEIEKRFEDAVKAYRYAIDDWRLEKKVKLKKQLHTAMLAAQAEYKTALAAKEQADATTT